MLVTQGVQHFPPLDAQAGFEAVGGVVDACVDHLFMCVSCVVCVCVCDCLCATNRSHRIGFIRFDSVRFDWPNRQQQQEITKQKERTSELRELVLVPKLRATACACSGGGDGWEASSKQRLRIHTRV
jgi:hypothetical protein